MSRTKAERRRDRAARKGKLAALEQQVETFTPAGSRPHALYSEGTGPDQTVSGAEEPVEVQQAAKPQTVAKPPVAVE